MTSSTIRTTLEMLGRNRSLKRRLPARLGHRAIWVSPDARLRFLLPSSRAFDTELLEFVERLVSPGCVVLDIGANVGEFSVTAAHCAGPSGAVLSIEADPFLAVLLQRTLAEADNQDLNLEIMCAAVSSQTGTARFNIAKRGRAANALTTVGSTQMGGVRGSLLVPTISVDDLVAAWREPDLIKIDVEGAELAVFQGASKLLQRRPPVIFFEATRFQAEIATLLAGYGYQLFDPSQPTFDNPITECVFNTLAIHGSRLSDIRRGGPISAH